MKFFFLLVGVMVFVFYQFNASPLNFNPAADTAVKNSIYSEEYKALENKHLEIEKSKSVANLNYGISLESENNTLQQEKSVKEIQAVNLLEMENREQAKEIIKKANNLVETNDKDYVFIHFILNNLPRGLIGLLLAVILSAAMSSTASELNALASTTVIDMYKRNEKTVKNDRHYVKAS